MTQKEIASMLGISRTTVARALKGDKNIKPETKEKILKLCEEVGYKKNYIGSVLANLKTKKIYAFLVKSKNSKYLEEIMEGINMFKEETSQYNVSLEIIITDIEKPKEQIIKLNTILKYNDVDGIIIIPMLKDEVKSSLKNYPYIPLVSLDKKINDDISYIGSDYKNSGKIVAGILTKIARKDDQILIIDSNDDKISSSLYIEGFKERIRASNLKNVKTSCIKNLNNNLDEILKIDGLEKIKYIYTPRYISKVANFLNNKNLKNIKIVANGVDKETVALLKSDQIVVTTKENYFLQGYLSGKIIFNKINGKNEKIGYITKTEVVFKENLSQIEANHERDIFKKFNIF